MAEEWFLIQTKPNAHNIAVRNLLRQGFVTFFPVIETTRRRANRFVSALRPLFPGYMFVRLDSRISPWRAINSTLGVNRIVSFGRSPTPVPQDLVETLRARCDATGRLIETRELAAGTPVEVVEGPFAEFVGTVETIEPAQRVWILLEFMGNQTRVAVKAGQVIRR